MAPESGFPIVMPSGRFAGREAFAQLVRDAFACAAQQGWREIICSDASFEEWPLHEQTVLDSLHTWSKAGRRFVMFANRYDALTRNQARFVAWRKTWGHIIECRVCRNIDSVDFPSAIWTPVWACRRIDLFHSTGVCGSEPERKLRTREILDELLLSSSLGFPASTIGL